MDVVRGAVVGATLGALGAYAMRAFAVQEAAVDETTLSVAPHLRSNPILAASLHRLSELKEANPRSSEIYLGMLQSCETLLRAERADDDNLSQFRLNRVCSGLKRSLRQLCAAAGENRNFTEAARTLVATETDIINDFCERFLHNMVIGA